MPTGRTKRIKKPTKPVKAARKKADPVPRPRGARGRLAAMAGGGAEGEDCVAQCIHAQQPGVEIEDEFTLSALGVNTMVLEGCLNAKCNFERPFGGQIQGAWTVRRTRQQVASRNPQSC